MASTERPKCAVSSDAVHVAGDVLRERRVEDELYFVGLGGCAAAAAAATTAHVDAQSCIFAAAVARDAPAKRLDNSMQLLLRRHVLSLEHLRRKVHRLVLRVWEGRAC
uniref:Uncharacterized protein n=1 Tax=Phaeomonas parva TaxID=124430 RepID=A0A7S1XPF9_9STRA